MMLSPMKF